MNWNLMDIGQWIEKQVCLTNCLKFHVLMVHYAMMDSKFVYVYEDLFCWWPTSEDDPKGGLGGIISTKYKFLLST